MNLHIVLSLLLVVVPCQHVEHVLPKTCYVLVYHQRILLCPCSTAFKKDMFYQTKPHFVWWNVQILKGQIQCITSYWKGGFPWATDSARFNVFKQPLWTILNWRNYYYEAIVWVDLY